MATIKVIKTVYQLRRDTAANWEANKTVVPAAGEPCFVIDQNILKIGDGIKTFEELPAIGGVDVSADGKSLILEDGTFKLFGFDAAAVGAQPRKKEDGTIEWVVPSTETLEGLQTIVAGLQNDVAELQEVINPTSEGAVPLVNRIDAAETLLETLTGDANTDGSILKTVQDEINDFATKVSDDGTVNTIKELVDYVAEHGPEAAQMASDISTLQGLVGSTAVSDQIADAIAVSGHINKAEALVIFDKVKYEISNKPVGTLVNYTEKEIRVMCPADTVFEVQNVGATGDASKYYIGFKAYAPDGAASFKEDLKITIEDDTMYYFEGNEFAGTDAYGRKYSIVWLPVANHNDDDTWTYYGANSSAGKFIGWYYSVEWYDADGVKIASDTIRINLTNEDCHNAIVQTGISGVKVGGSLLEAVEGKVNIPIATDTILGVVKGSTEVGITDEGALAVGEISLEKIIQPDNLTLVMDGGTSVN